jgi:hypothetical protein
LATRRSAEDTARQLEYFRLFDRCFFSVRVAIGLELRLSRAPAMAPGEALDERDDRADPSEDERADSDTRPERERFEADRDRERETERASLPALLRTLEAVAAEAAALPGPEPAALPTLRELLAHVAPGSPPKTIPTPSPRPPGTDLRARLTASGAAVTLERPPRPAGLPADLAVRRATGPPRPA